MSYFVTSISNKDYQRKLESCKRLFPAINDSDEIYVGGGVAMTKAGWCNVLVREDR